ncbi:hypothetical protein SBA4_4410010 [Candidatus Sulfopaludibacter sp. SbA4]|nr:hypothetical protein SBA4_4410010 [Candidatus Sulfopaludibacter sp. SbA4]
MKHRDNIITRDLKGRFDDASKGLLMSDPFMSDPFRYDVFLSHSSKDKGAVREIATRLSADGLSVWFDQWAIRPGDNIPAKIEEGLETSRVLVLCMSTSAFGIGVGNG